MARDQSELTSIAKRGIDPETFALMKTIKQIVGAPAGATGDFPERHIAEALNDLKDGDLLKIQENLELLSDALKLWLGEPSQAPTATTSAMDTADVKDQADALDAGSGRGGHPPRGASEADNRTPTTISAFLQSVGKAVIEAQGELDKSLTAPDNTNASAAYRIPKLSAEIAFEVEKADESGVNILLASRSSSERESLKQKVCFDIVAVPLPAELSLRNQLAEIILNRLPEGDPWRERLAGATLLRQARGTLALSLAVQGQDGPSLLVAPDSGDTVKGPLKLEPALGKALASILAKV
ncbi:MAG: hypothetical protein IPJ73_21650 [Zoogloea sp.]|nr:hypothetical protein [Zoogloea sp.]